MIREPGRRLWRRDPRRRTRVCLALTAALSVVLAACGSDDREGTLTVADAGFTESRILADMYGLLLEKAGYAVERTSVQSAEMAQSALTSGQIDAMPQYVATYAELLNIADNGVDADPVASARLDASLAALRELIADRGVTVLDPATAVSQVTFVVGKSFAERHGLTTLTDLGESNLSVTLAAGPDCSSLPFCEEGLEQTYGIDVADIIESGVSTAQTKAAVRDGEAELGAALTTDADLDGLVVLVDDKMLQNADNPVPIVNTASLTPEISEALNRLAPILTTGDLARLNQHVDANREKPADVARQYLEDEGLLT